MKNIPAILLLAAVSTACGDDSETAERHAAARGQIQAFATALQGELKAALDSGGALEAIRVCSERAPLIADANARDGRTVRRIGTRVRNAATNTPTAAETEILDRFAALPEAERAAAFEETGSGDGRAFYAPIFIANPLCLTCHGPADELAPAIRDALATRYPDDRATGYAMGDLRGAFVVEPAR